MLIRAGTRHDYGTAPGHGHWNLQFAHFHPRPDWLALLDWPEPVAGVRLLHTSGEAHRRVTESFDRAVTMSRSGLAQAELFSLNAFEATLLWADMFRPEPGHLDPRLATVLEHVSARLSEPLSTATLARTAGLSASRLTHLFVAQLGTPPMRFVEQQRMRVAQQLLDMSSGPGGRNRSSGGLCRPALLLHPLQTPLRAVAHRLPEPLRGGLCCLRTRNR